MKSLALWLPDDRRTVSAFDVFHDEHRTQIKARVAAVRTGTQDNLKLYNVIKSDMWNALSGDEREEYGRRALEENEKAANRSSDITTIMQ